MTAVAMKLNDIKELLNVDTIGRKAGVITVRREFFYTHGRTSSGLASQITKAIPQATIIDHGEVWKAFSGRASTANSSHWFVKFVIAPKS